MLATNNAKLTLEQAYVTLHVKSSSSITEIKTAYRKAASLYHPDAQSGQADVEKFHRIVQAYNMILEERKNGKSGAGGGWITLLLRRSRERILRLINGGAMPRENRFGSFTNQGYWSTLNHLARKIDLAEKEEDRIKALRAIFRLYRSSFIGAALPRLEGAEGALLLELIKLLAATADPQALEAVAAHLFSGDLETRLTAFVALEEAGPAGHAAAAQALGLKSSILTRLMDSLSYGAGEYNQATPAQARRMRAFSRRCGAPMSHIMRRMGGAA